MCAKVTIPSGIFAEDFKAIVDQCEVPGKVRTFFVEVGIDTIPKYAYCVFSEQELQDDIVIAAGDTTVALKKGVCTVNEAHYRVGTIVSFAPFWFGDTWVGEVFSPVIK